MKAKLLYMILLCCCFLSGCGKEKTGETPFVCKVTETAEHSPIFSVSPHTYVEEYNRLCEEKQEILLPLVDWYVVTLPQGIHTEKETLRYDFSEDKEVWSMPTLSFYVPKGSDTVAEVTVNFDEHGFTEDLYAKYKAMSLQTLQIFFPDTKKETLEKRYTDMVSYARTHTVSNEEGYKNGVVPAVLYEKDGIGVYPYFAIGESLHICIVPVTEEQLSNWQEKGAEIFALE